MGRSARRTIVLSTADIKEPTDVTEKAFHLYSILCAPDYEGS
jgi:hypothetical protein